MLLYRDEKAQAVLDLDSGLHYPADMIHNNILCGSDYPDLLRDTKLTKDDVLMPGSLDGASNTRIFIWIVNDIALGSLSVFAIIGKI